MHRPDAMPEASDLIAVRRLLAALLLVGILGMATELLLIGHLEGALQLAPLILLGVSTVVLAWYMISGHPRAVLTLQVVMTLVAASGAVGVVLHYQGNRAFELEMYPTMSGFELVRETLSGATPVLAPGSMTLIGLVGLTMTFRHPSLRPPGTRADSVERYR